VTHGVFLFFSSLIVSSLTANVVRRLAARRRYVVGLAGYLLGLLASVL
jgi:hypothetical protein